MLSGGQGTRMPDDCSRLRDDFNYYMKRLHAGQKHSGLEAIRAGGLPLSSRSRTLASIPRAGVITKGSGPAPRNFAWDPVPADAGEEGMEEDDDLPIDGENWQQTWAKRYNKGPLQSDYTEAFKWPQVSTKKEPKSKDLSATSSLISEEDDLALREVVEDSVLESALDEIVGDSVLVPPAEMSDAAAQDGEVVIVCPPEESRRAVPLAKVDHVAELLGGHPAPLPLPPPMQTISHEAQEEEEAARRGLPRAAVDHVAYLFGGGAPPLVLSEPSVASIEESEGKSAPGIPRAAIDHVASLLRSEQGTSSSNGVDDEEQVNEQVVGEALNEVMTGGHVVDVSEYQSVYQAPSREALLLALRNQTVAGRSSNMDHVSGLLRGGKAHRAPSADSAHLQRLKVEAHEAKSRVKMSDLMELLRMRQPSKPVIALLRVMAHVLVMPAIKWPGLRSHLLKMRHEIPILLAHFNVDSPSINVRVLSSCSKPWAHPAAISRVSAAAVDLCNWLGAVNAYTRARLGLTLIQPSLGPQATKKTAARKGSKQVRAANQVSNLVEGPVETETPQEGDGVLLLPVEEDENSKFPSKDSETDSSFVPQKETVTEDGSCSTSVVAPRFAPERPGSALAEAQHQAPAVRTESLEKRDPLAASGPRLPLPRPATKRGTTWGRKPNPLASKPQKAAVNPILMNRRYPVPVGGVPVLSEYDAKFTWRHQQHQF